MCNSIVTGTERLGFQTSLPHCGQCVEVLQRCLLTVFCCQFSHPSARKINFISGVVYTKQKYMAASHKVQLRY